MIEFSKLVVIGMGLDVIGFLILTKQVLVSLKCSDILNIRDLVISKSEKGCQNPENSLYIRGQKLSDEETKKMWEGMSNLMKRGLVELEEDKIQQANSWLSPDTMTGVIIKSRNWIYTGTGLIVGGFIMQIIGTVTGY